MIKKLINKLIKPKVGVIILPTGTWKITCPFWGNMFVEYTKQPELRGLRADVFVDEVVGATGYIEMLSEKLIEAREKLAPVMNSNRFDRIGLIEPALERKKLNKKRRKK